MDRDAPDIAASQFDLARMEACAKRQTNLFGSIAKCQRAAHGAPWAIERRQYTITSRLDQIPPMLANHRTGELIMIVQEPAPALVAHRCCTSSGADDIGKQNGRKHTFTFPQRAIAVTRDKLLDITKQCISLAGPKAVVSLRIFNVLSALDRLGQAATKRNRHHEIS